MQPLVFSPHWGVRALGFAVLLQSIEMLSLRHAWSDRGVWSWSALRNDFVVLPAPIFKVLEGLFTETRFRLLLLFQLVCAVALVFQPERALAIGLFFSVFLVSVRWRGVFNGGSDAMTLSQLLALAFFPSRMALLYIGVQVVFSYFIAGVIKLKEPSWRSGKSLQCFLASERYSVPPLIVGLSRFRGVCFVLSWCVMLFECTAPLLYFFPQAISPYLILGALFHLTNVYVFGLNRFFWTWIATYPALYWAVQST